MSKKNITFAPDLGAEVTHTHAHMRTKKTKQKNMEAVRQTSYDWDSNVMEHPIIDPNWKTQPMRAWDDVYEDLCREVGVAFGLNDIREA